MKGLMKIVLSVCCILGLTACSNEGELSIAGEVDVANTTEQVENVAILYAVHSMGGVGAEAHIEEYDYYYDDELTVEMLADGLSELTGLDFYLSEVVEDNGSATIRWSDDSTLIANLDSRVQKEEFFFYDADSMRWFMMDSLYKTIIENTDVTEVYYLASDGEELWFEELYPINTFETSAPYQGSDFYYSQAE